MLVVHGNDCDEEIREDERYALHSADEAGARVADALRFPPVAPVREAGAERMTRSSHRRARRHVPLRPCPRVAVRAPTSGASWWATKAGGECERSSRPLGQRGPANCAHLVPLGLPSHAAPIGSSMSVRVPGRVVRRGRSGVERWRHWRAHRHLSSRCARSLRRVRR